jgi:hypothetical protein
MAEGAVLSQPLWCGLFAAVQIPLLQTLPGTSTGGRQLRWYSLLRRKANEHITGDLQVRQAEVWLCKGWVWARRWPFA